MRRFAFIPVLALFLLIPAGEAQAELRLKAIMAGLMSDMDEIRRGIKDGDFKAVEEHAKKVANHEKPPMEERERIMGFLKDEADGFKSADMEVHNAATGLAEAAAQMDNTAVIVHYSRILRGCLKCHTRYRARVVDHFYGGDGD